jgi:hypothetical protein
MSLLPLFNSIIFNIFSLKSSGKLFIIDPKLLLLHIPENNDNPNRADSFVETDDPK